MSIHRTYLYFKKVLECSEEVLFLFGRTRLVHDLQVHGECRICEAHEEGALPSWSLQGDADVGGFVA